MSRFVQKIKGKFHRPVQVIILAAGAGARTKSYEPRCLLKYKKETIIENQISIIKNKFPKAEITVVIGIEGHKVIKKIGKSARFVENQIYYDSNSAESLRLGINNCLLDDIIFLHGDLIISENIFENINMNNSFLITDDKNQFEDKEVGVTVVNNKATFLSYNLDTKWCQIAYLNQEAVTTLRKLFIKPEFETRYLLTFEIINKLIDSGIIFNCFDTNGNFIKEIDSLKDLNNEIVM